MRLLISLALLVLLGGGIFLALRSTDEPVASSEPVESTTSTLPAGEPATVESKLDSLLAGRPVRLSGPELTDLLQAQGALWASRGSSPPVVAIRNDTVYVTGSIATDRLPSDPTLDAVRMFLPDTTPVAISGTLRAADDSTLAFEIAAVEVASMPVPGSYIPEVLNRLGFERRADVAPNAIAVPLPGVITRADIAGDTLVLTP